jgi:Uma2 family endonuclease
MATTQSLLTAEEFLLLPDTGEPLELVCGVPTPMNRPNTGHGLICSAIVEYLAPFVRERGLGRLVANDSGVITRRGPDTVRGPDVAYFSFQRLPVSSDRSGYPAAVPELVFEVRSPSDSPRKVIEKALEFLDAGVLMICVLDPEARTATIYRSELAEETVLADATLAFPELLPGWELPLGKLFE